MMCITFLNFYIFMGLFCWLCQWQITKTGVVYLEIKDLLVAVILWPFVLLIMVFQIRGMEVLWKRNSQ